MDALSTGLAPDEDKYLVDPPIYESRLHKPVGTQRSVGLSILLTPCYSKPAPLCKPASCPSFQGGLLCSKFPPACDSTLPDTSSCWPQVRELDQTWEGLGPEFNKSRGSPELTAVLFCGTRERECTERSWSVFTRLLLTGAFQVTCSLCLSMDLFIQPTYKMQNSFPFFDSL